MSARRGDRSELARQAWSTIAGVFFSEEMSERFRRACAAADLSNGGSLKALLSLGDSPSSMRSVAEKLRCDASYITGLIDELESLGYVRRVESPKDRRVKLIEIRPKGQEARSRAKQVLHEPPQALDRFTDAEIAAFARLVAKLA